MPQEELILLVQKLRDGDTTVKATIIGSHMRLAMSIVAKYAHRYSYIVDDMVGAAMMGICQAVDWAPTRMYDNNISPYIYCTVERFIRDLIETRFIVTIPRHAFKTWHEEQDAFVPLVQMIESLHSDEEGYLDEYDLITEPAAKIIEENPILFEELLESLSLSAKERMVVDMLLEDYNGAEIGKALGVTRMSISLIKQQVAEKLKKKLRSKKCTATMGLSHT